MLYLLKEFAQSKLNLEKAKRKLGRRPYAELYYFLGLINRSLGYNHEFKICMQEAAKNPGFGQRVEKEMVHNRYLRQKTPNT